MKKFGLAVFVIVLTLGAALLLRPAAAGLSGSLSLVGSTSVQPLAEELAKAFMTQNPKVNITVAGGGSGAGIKAVQSAQAEIGTSSRELTAEEEQGLAATVIAKDGIAVVVQPQNKVKALTMDQVKRVYAGQITDWKDLGGAKAAIVVISREAGSGTRGAFEELVLGKTPVSTSILVQGSTGAVRQTVAVTKNAIGYISLGQLDKTVKSLKINNIEPVEANVLNKTYPISRPFLFLTKGAPRGLVKTFIDWVLSPTGQAIVAKEFVAVGKTK